MSEGPSAAPACMLNPELAAQVAERDGWEWRCPVPLCKTVTQGGKPGLDAHLQVVHGTTLSRWSESP